MNISFSEVNKWGRFDITIGGITIKGCTHKFGESAKGKYEFIAMPQHKVTGKDGVEKWVSDIYLDKETSAAVLAAFKGNASAMDDTDIPF